MKYTSLFFALLLALGARPSAAALADITPSERRVCSVLLEKSNISWENVSDNDYYSVKTPTGFSEPEWKRNSASNAYLDIQTARFDFTGEGKEALVYTIRYEGSHYYYYHYIVAAPGEDSLLRNRVYQVDNGEALSQLEADLIYAHDGMFGATANGDYLKKEALSPMKSALYDASNTTTYDGWYTRSKILLHDGKAYLVAWTNSAPSITIFRPEKSGHLEPLCSHTGEPSHKEDITTPIGHSAFICPASLKAQKIPWDRKTETAFVDLPEWGGKRPVKRDVIALGSSGMGMSKLYVGSINATIVDKEENWPPLTTLGEDYYDTIALHLTDQGPYILVGHDDPTDDNPPQRTYYRIDKNTLVPVCSAISKIIPPRGYANGVEKQ